MRAMHEIFSHLLDKSVVVYLDDILIYSKDYKSHLKHVQEVLEILRQHKFYAKDSKCIFATNTVEFLGHIVTYEGITTDPKKIQAVREWHVPSTALFRFFGHQQSLAI